MELPSISLDRTVLCDLEKAIQKEWLITNDLGGYASSTVLGINTRKYHGLLVAAVHPPRDRRVFLTKLDEEIVAGNTVFQLGANEFKDVMFPQGNQFLYRFSISPFPTYTYAAGNVKVEKTVFMPHERNCSVAIYNILNKNNFEVKARIFPLINWRHFHSVTDRWNSSEFDLDARGGTVKISFRTPQSCLLMTTTGGQYSATGYWIERMYLREEARRGESCFDDCYQPGYFEKSIDARKSEDFAVVAAAEQDVDTASEVLHDLPSTLVDLKELQEEERKRQLDFLSKFHSSKERVPASDWLDWLVLASDAFIVKAARNRDKSLIAGYHWFGPWGRDTFISLPGLMLITSRFEDARTVFLSFAKYFNRGLIPNFIPDETEDPAYNTVDATLWYINAVLQYLKYTGDFRFVRQQLWNVLKSVIENHVEGTLFDIHVDADGLLSHGPQLTWVDASVEGQPVLPRAGKAVEIQVLWYNALKTVELLAERFGESNQKESYAQLAERARKSFVDKFWNAERGYLCDVVGVEECDGSLRPNQIFAAALDFTMLNEVIRERIVNVIMRELLTSCGLRTLARSDPRYVGVYSGDRASRDRAYHSGTVWPWLLGPFTTAFLKAKGSSESQREFAFQNFLEPLVTQRIYQAGLGTLSEIFDGDPPHTPRGCVAQAWSVAEPLRAYVEDVLQIRPVCEREVLQSSG